MSGALHRPALARLFVERFRVPVDSFTPVRGDGSDRLIFRIRGGGRSCIGISGANLEENRAFIGFTEAFHRAGLPVPELYAVDESGRYYIEEDLGDELLFDWQSSRRTGNDFPPEVMDMYRRVMTDLLRFQIDAVAEIDYGLCYQGGEFGRAAMAADAEYFRALFLERFYRGKYDANAFRDDCVALIGRLLEADRRFFLYRDFQSRNILICGGALRYIDYQSGRRGALHYDAASLLFDARPRIPQYQREELLDAYTSELSKRSPQHARGFQAVWYGFALLRVMQAMGAFGKLGAGQGKRQFLLSLSPGLENMASLAANAPVLRSLPCLNRLFHEIPHDESVIAEVDGLVNGTVVPE